MINLKFKISNDFLLQHICRSYDNHKKFNEIRRLLANKNESLYSILSQNIEPILLKTSISKTLKESNKNSNNILKEIYANPVFLKLVKETELYKNNLESQWNKAYVKTQNILEEITGLELSKITIDISVIVSHPNLTCGRSFTKIGTITWAHKDEWDNYSIVYLWHEIMHHLTKDFKGNFHLLHALIELACDNELRIRLNKNGKYFNANGISIGHKYLRNIENHILPAWKSFLKEKNENIVDLAKRLRPKLKIELANLAY